MATERHVPGPTHTGIERRAGSRDGTLADLPGPLVPGIRTKITG